MKKSFKTMSRVEKIGVGVAVIVILSSILIVGKYLWDKSLESSANLNTCVPYGVEVTSQSTTEVKITWQTDKNCISSVKYGLSLDELTYQSLSNGSKSSKTHEVNLTKLQAGFNYYYVIVSDSKQYGLNGLPLSFSTKAF